MDKNRKKEIVKMLLNQNINTEDEDELIDLLVDKSIAMDVDKADKDNEKFGDKVSVAFGLTFNSIEKTLQTEDVDKLIKSVIFRLEKEFGAEIRQ